MGVSRDEARELAIMGLLIALGLRIGVGVLRAIEELTFPSSARSVMGQLFAQIGSTVGLFTLGAVLLVVLSPRGSVTPGLRHLVRRVAGVMTALGLAGAFFALSFAFSGVLGRLEFAMQNGLTATALAGTGWWVMKNFDEER
jgi:hypothetical protein